MAEDMHETPTLEVSVGYDRIVISKVLQGSYDYLAKSIQAYDVGGQPAGGQELQDVKAVWPDKWNSQAVNIKISDFKFSRNPANRGTLSMTVTGVRNLCIWGLDFSEVTKDIRTWHQDKSDKKEKPDLSIISSWEALKGDTARIEEYQNFKYFDGTTLREMEEGSPTKNLAKMMFKGIENYSIYIPVISCQAISMSFDDINNANTWGSCGEKLSTIVSVDAISPPGNFDSLGLEETSVYEWIRSIENHKRGGDQTQLREFLMSADRLTTNGDGSFVRNMQWTGLDYAEPLLYPGAKGDGDGSEGN